MLVVVKMAQLGGELKGAVRARRVLGIVVFVEVVGEVVDVIVWWVLWVLVLPVESCYEGMRLEEAERSIYPARALEGFIYPMVAINRVSVGCSSLVARRW